MAELDEPLSEREQEVLELLAQGTTNKEIAASLFISPNTVKVHLRNINTKLGARSRTEASRVALERGLVVIPGMELTEPAKPPPPEPVEVGSAGPISDTEEVPSPEAQPIDTLAIAAQPAEVEIKGTDRDLFWVYLFGGIALFVALLGVIAWFVFNPRVIEPELVAVFEPAELGERWFSSQPLPESLAAASAVAVGTDIYLIGGRQSDGALNDELHVYDSVQHEWRTVALKPQPIANSAAVSLPDLLFAIGGETSDGEESDIVEVFIPSENEWRPVANLPKAISNGLAVTDGAQIYHLGGLNNGTAIADVYLFDLVANSWATLPDIPESRAGAIGGVVNGSLYVIGGENEAGEATADCFKFNLADQNWSSCSPMGNKRVDAGGVVILNKIYVIGGETGASFGELYNPESDIWEKIDQPMLDGLDTPIWSNAGVANVDAKVYVMGGEFNGTLSDDAYFYFPLVYQAFIPSASSSDE